MEVSAKHVHQEQCHLLMDNASVMTVVLVLKQPKTGKLVSFVMLVNFHLMKDIANHVHQEQCHLKMDNVNAMTVVLVLKQPQIAKHVNFVTPENFHQDLENANFVLKGPFQHPKEQLNVKFVHAELNQILETQIAKFVLQVGFQLMEVLAKHAHQGQ